MTYALREARSLAAHALAAPIAREIALTALTALGLSRDPVHEPVHARGGPVTPTTRSGHAGDHPRAAAHTKAVQGTGRHGDADGAIVTGTPNRNRRPSHDTFQLTRIAGVSPRWLGLVQGPQD